MSNYPPDGYEVGGGNTTWANDFSIIDGSGSVTGVSNPGGGDIRVASAGHGLITGQYVRLYSMTIGGYDGEYVITDHDDDWFDVTVAFAGDATGKWVCNLAGPDCIRFEASTPSADPYYYWEARIEVHGGMPYRMSALVQTASIAAGNTVAVYVEWYDASDTLLSTDYVHNAVLGAIGTWYNLSGVFTAPATARYAMIYVGKNNTSFCAWLDDIAFMEMPYTFFASHQTANQTIVSGGGWTTVEFNNESYDYGGGFDTANFRYDVLADGLYDFIVRIEMVQNGGGAFDDGADMSMQIDAGAVGWLLLDRRWATGNETFINLTGSTGPVWCDVGDQIIVQVNLNNNVANALIEPSIKNRFSGAKVE